MNNNNLITTNQNTKLALNKAKSLMSITKQILENKNSELNEELTNFNNKHNTGDDDE